ncbi:VanZ family protein [Romboutsia sp. 1001713B170207_170306_H8]|uniref:VanZ family protein n=1 Tax=Romboutsia sp. 1001713B170207_170306_H8 TaxID=2787112 RepID=UPI001897A6A5|nr:VanZ family protein [Romboutsia sp. 1001713B170207_170306_H8]
MHLFRLKGLLALCLLIWIITRIIILMNKSKNKIRIRIWEEVLTSIFTIYIFILVRITISHIHTGVNILILSPFIIYLCIKYENRRSLKKSISTSFLISFTIELSKLVINILYISNLKIFYPEDLILNILGGSIGWFAFNILYKGKIKNIIDRVYINEKKPIINACI